MAVTFGIYIIIKGYVCLLYCGIFLLGNCKVKGILTIKEFGYNFIDVELYFGHCRT